MKKFGFARRAVLLTALFAGLAATSALAQEARVSLSTFWYSEPVADGLGQSTGHFSDSGSC